MDKYEALRDRHDFISLDELSRVCKIAKQTARYLVEHEIIPATDTGKKTWRYRIAIDDVISYLRHRDKVGSMIPPGAVTSRKDHKNRRLNGRRSYTKMVETGQIQEMFEYFSFIFSECGDTLTTTDIVELTGLEKSTVLKSLRAGHIKSVIQSPKYIVPKQYLLEFLISQRFIESRTRSERYMQILGGFEIWKTAKSSQ